MDQITTTQVESIDPRLLKLVRKLAANVRRKVALQHSKGKPVSPQERAILDLCDGFTLGELSAVGLTVRTQLLIEATSGPGGIEERLSVPGLAVLSCSLAFLTPPALIEARRDELAELLGMMDAWPFHR